MSRDKRGVVNPVVVGSSPTATANLLGVSLRVIRKIFSHTSIKITERHVRVNDSAVAVGLVVFDLSSYTSGPPGTRRAVAVR
jgi:hypothetical protein